MQILTFSCSAALWFLKTCAEQCECSAHPGMLVSQRRLWLAAAGVPVMVP